MALSYVNSGTAAVGAGSLSIPLPASLATNNILVLPIAHKYGVAPPAPVNWEFVGDFIGGAGSSGADSGQVRSSIFCIRVPSEGLAGNVAVTLSGGNSARGRIHQYTKTLNAGTVWGFALAGGASNTPGLAWAVIALSNPGITTGDLIVAMSAVDSDLATFSAQALLATGATLGVENERDDGSTTTGDDLAQFVSDHLISLGLASAPPTYSALASATAGNAPAGATAFLRLRELPGLPGGDLATGVVDVGTDLSGLAAHDVRYESDVFLLTGPDIVPFTGFFRMRGFDTSLARPVYWTAPGIDVGGTSYVGPGPVNQIVVFKVIASP